MLRLEGQIDRLIGNKILEMVDLNTNFVWPDPDATFAIRSTLQPRLAPVDFLYFGVDLGVGFCFGNGDPIAIPLVFEAGSYIDLDPTKFYAYLTFLFPALY